MKPAYSARFKWVRPDLIAPLLLTIIGILFFYDFLFTSKNQYFRDILNFHYPLRRVLIDALARGELPLWNPFVYLGQPMLANPNHMAFYPTNLFHLFLPFNYAFKLHFIIHPILAGLGAYFLQRRLGIACLPAFTGSLAYEFSGTVLSFLNLYNIIPAVALLPWAGWAFYGALQTRWLRRALLLGALLAMQAVAFEPLMFQCDLWLLAGLTVFFLLESDNRAESAINIMRVALVAAVFALGLAAAQILPTLELLPNSARTKLPFGEVSYWSMHPLDVLSTIIPNLFGADYTIGQSKYWGEAFHEARESYLVSFFLGSSTLLLAVLGCASRRKKMLWVFGLLTVISTVLAMGKFGPVYGWLYRHIPIFALGRYPSKYFLLSTLVLCLMASMGVEVLFDKDEKSAKRRAWVGILGVILGVALAGCWVYFGAHSDILKGWLQSTTVKMKNIPELIAQLRRALVSSSVFLTLAGGLLVSASFLNKKLFWRGIIPLIIAAELMPANLRISPLISDADVSFVPEVNRYIKALNPAELYRVVSPTMFISPTTQVYVRGPNDSMAWMILYYKLSGQPLYGITEGIQYSIDRPIDHLTTLEAERLLATCNNISTASCITLLAKLNTPIVLSIKPLTDKRLVHLSSFRTGSPQPVHVYWLNNTVMRASFASGFDYAGSHEQALSRFLNPNFPIGTTAILEGKGGQKVGAPGLGSAKILKYENNRVICSVNAKTQGHLVLLDSYYPGWVAYVDGRESKVLRANYAFRAVPVSAGTHRVEFVYRPKSVYLGLAISLIFLVGGLLIVGVSAFRYRQQK